MGWGETRRGGTIQGKARQGRDQKGARVCKKARVRGGAHPDLCMWDVMTPICICTEGEEGQERVGAR